MPTSGSTLHVYDGEKKIWQAVFENLISDDEAENIIKDLKISLIENGIEISDNLYGAQFENRGAQITFSALGQDAPISEKQGWDPDHTKREAVVNSFLSRQSDYEVKIGGLTSIDITKKGIDKAYGVDQLCKHLSVNPKECVFVGDEFFEGGNDISVKKTGVKMVVVGSPNDTLNFIRWNIHPVTRNIFQRPTTNPILGPIKNHKW